MAKRPSGSAKIRLPPSASICRIPRAITEPYRPGGHNPHGITKLRVVTLLWCAGGASVVFTGIVERTGELTDLTENEDGRRLTIAADGLDDLHHGQSINVSGVCLTVEAFDNDERSSSGNRTESDDSDMDWFEVFLASETVEKTYLGELGVGDQVNIERAMPADGRFDGHIVQGHVDTTATVEAIEQVGEDWRYTFALPEGLEKYVVQKGSITVDGISLTVAERREDAFEVAIIPATRELTTLSEKAIGDPVHLEVDVMAKYVERMVEGYR
jgi:riboflavin synthase